MIKRVVVTGGGTGGHLKVAKSLIDEFYKRGVEVYFIGSTTGQDREWFEGYEKIKEATFLNTSGVVNKRGLGKLSSLMNILSATKKSLSILNSKDIDCVISVGGFSAAPASFATILKSSCALYIHEQNSTMGRLNKITSKFAKELFSSYSEESKVKDYPVSLDFFENARVRSEVKTVIFLGGSQGARAINNYALSVAKILDEKGIKIIHQAGKLDYERVKSEYEKLGVEVDVFDFTKDLLSKIEEADFAISRAGASTLWELCANNLPALFIPYPYAAANHQYTNAKFLVDRGLGFVKKESELKEAHILEILDMDISKISKELQSSIKKDGIKELVEFIVKEG